MRPRRLKAAFRDARGEITDILDGVPLNSVTIISSKKGVVRGNHVHRRTVQYTYLLSGRVRYVCRTGERGRLRSYLLRPGELAASPPGEAHAVVALADSSFMVFSHGPRHGRSYEDDTFRLAVPIAAASERRRPR